MALLPHTYHTLTKHLGVLPVSTKLWDVAVWWSQLRTGNWIQRQQLASTQNRHNSIDEQKCLENKSCIKVICNVGDACENRLQQYKPRTFTIWKLTLIVRIILKINRSTQVTWAFKHSRLTCRNTSADFTARKALNSVHSKVIQLPVSSVLEQVIVVPVIPCISEK